LTRNIICQDETTFKGLCDYFEQTREGCKKIIEIEEYSNAETLYSRVLGKMKNMPRKIRDGLSEEEGEKRN